MYPQKKFYTLDLETFVTKGLHRPFAASICQVDEKEKKSIIQIYPSSPFLLLESLFLRCFHHFPNHRYVFYCHNLGRFEGPLLTEYFVRHPRCRIKNLLIHENKIIMLHVRLRQRDLIFKDSLNFLPFPLLNLTAMMFPQKKKLPLPFNPFLSNYEKLSLSTYVKRDAQSLGVIMHVFRTLIKHRFLQDPLSCFGIPGLALKTFASFFHKEKIFNPEKAVIRKSFKGGLNFIKKNTSRQIIAFDVNSLYPFCMLNKLPLNTAKFEEKVTLENFFGFVFVSSIKKKEVYATKETDHSITEEFIKSPSILFSEEAKYAEKLGYSLNIEWGLRYQSSYSVFHSFVNYFYNLKKSNRSIDAILAKLIMNSLYGKLGMKTNYPSYWIVDRHDLFDFASQGKNIKLIKSFSSNAHLIETKEDLYRHPPLISTPIASAIASYGRMTIHQWISKKHLEVCYSDTDSLFSSSQLPNTHITTNLGGFKKIYPNSWPESIFLKSKIYGLKKNHYHINKIKSIRNPKWEHLTELQQQKKIRFHQERWFMRKNHVLTLVQSLELRS